jgi:hypothetical protein
MILTYDTTQDLNLKTLTSLTDKLSYSKGYVPLKHVVAILRHPHKVIFNLVFCMTPMSIIHSSAIISQLLAECYPPKGGGLNL